MEIGIKMDGYWGSYRTADEESMQSTRLESIGLTSGGRLDFSGPFGRAFRAEMPVCGVRMSVLLEGWVIGGQIMLLYSSALLQ